MVENEEDTRKIVEEFVFSLFRGDKKMPILYYIPQSPPCRAVLLLARLLNLKFELHMIDVIKGDQLKPEFMKINPQHCVPTLVDDGFSLWESRAILTYLVSAYASNDKLYPIDVRTRAIVDQRLQFDLGTLYARTTDYFFGMIFLGTPLDPLKRSLLVEAMNWYEGMLRRHMYAACEHFTIADLSLVVTISQIEAFDFDMVPYPRIRAWLQRCKVDLEAYGFEEINQTGAHTLSNMLFSKMTDSRQGEGHFNNDLG